jgi:hypothetical protein
MYDKKKCEKCDTEGSLRIKSVKEIIPSITNHKKAHQILVSLSFFY